MGLLGATGVGIGAIVGGGILALAGVAFAATGPSAMVAFALNGLIAVLTALSFAEVSSKFPQSGGTYVFAKRVLSVESAFMVGWVVWFASIVAAALYAIGFGRFAVAGASELLAALGRQPSAWLESPWAALELAALATLFYTLALLWRSSGGGQLPNVGKVIVFTVLIAFGLAAVLRRPPGDVVGQLRPFFAFGTAGLLQAMGMTFIALQGFDLIAAVAGEIREPERTIPRAMLGSLAVALAIYLPLLFIVATVGTPGESVVEVGRRCPATIVAVAAENYLGSFGYWLVVVGAVLSMLSALHANLLAASRVAMSMARDRTMPRPLAVLSRRRRTPVASVLVTAALVVGVLLIVSDVTRAGAASSLIFLITFALAHWIAILVRQRSADRPPPFRVPLFPAVPVLGGLTCVSLAVYQGIAVPSAGLITVVWLSLGGLLFMGLFAHRARIADASLAALDPEHQRLRGRSPLVLVPIANPDNAASLVAVASALAAPQVGRVLLLSVIVTPRDWRPKEDSQPLDRAQRVLREAIAASAAAVRPPEALTTMAPSPWPEIVRVARVHGCESLLLGLGDLEDKTAIKPLNRLINQLDCDVVLLRAAQGWDVSQARRILVPVAGRGAHRRLLARLLGSLSRAAPREVTFLRVLPERATGPERLAAARLLAQVGQDLWPGEHDVEVELSASPVETVAEHAARSDLVIVGVQRVSRREKVFGHFTLDLAGRTATPMLVISRGG